MFEDDLHTHARNLIALALCGWTIPTLRTVASAPDPDPGTGGGVNPPAPPAPPGPAPAPAPPAPPADNATIRAMRAELDKRAQEVTGFRAQLDKLAKENEELKHQQELAGKSAEERARIEAERYQRQFQAQLAEQKTQLEQARAAEMSARKELETYQITTRVQTAVAKSKVLPTAGEHAAQLFQLEAKVRLEEPIEQGKPKRMVATVDGIDHVDAMDAAFEKWLAKYPHLQAHPGGGSGAPVPNGGGVPLANMDNMSAQDLLAVGMAAKKRNR